MQKSITEIFGTYRYTAGTSEFNSIMQMNDYEISWNFVNFCEQFNIKPYYEPHRCTGGTSETYSNLSHFWYMTQYHNFDANIQILSNCE